MEDIEMKKENVLDDVAVIIGPGNPELGAKMISWIGENMNSKVNLLHLDFDNHKDRETNFKIVDNQKIKGKIVVIIESVYAEEPKLEIYLTQLLWATKYQYGAKSIILVLPFMQYRRQDHPEKTEEIHRNLYFVHQLKSNGADYLLLCDIHSPQTLKNCVAEGIRAVSVSSAQVFADQLRPQVAIAKSEGRKFYIFCPDKGSLPRNVILARLLGVPILMVLKRRLDNGSLEIYYDEKEIAALSAQYDIQILSPTPELVKGATICLSDDEASTCVTARTTGQDLLKQEAEEVKLTATHPVCADGWKAEIIGKEIFSTIIFGDTIPRNAEKRTGGRVTDVSVAASLASELLSLIAEVKAEKMGDVKTEATTELEPRETET